MAATGTWKVYVNAYKAAFNKEISIASDDIKLMICTSSYTPNQATHDYKNDVTNEVTGTGYTAGGVSLTSKTANTSSLVFTIDAADINIASSTITGGRVLVIYDNTPATDATKPLIAYCVLSGDESSVAGNWPHTFDAAGIFTTTVS